MYYIIFPANSDYLYAYIQFIPIKCKSIVMSTIQKILSAKIA